jgi:hypothetical protein
VPLRPVCRRATCRRRSARAQVRTEIIAFKEKGGDLTRQSFLRAASRFLEPVGLEINLVSDTQDFDAWLDSVDEVTRFYVTLKPPNPRWTKRAQETRDLAEEIAAERLSIEASSPHGMNVRDTRLDGAADTAALGNGFFRATGVAKGARRFYDSTRRFLSGIIDVSDEDTSDTIRSRIRDLLRELAPPIDRDDPEPPAGDDERA